MGFLDDHLKGTQQEAAAVAQDLRRNNHDRDMRVATWMLVGNGVALLAIFNAVISQNLCGWQTIQPYAGVFLLGLVSAAGHVVFDGEADNRGTARLTILMGATRRAAICIDSNNAFREWVRKNPTEPNEEVLRQVADNDATIAEAQTILQTKSEEPCEEKILRWMARGTLGLSALCLGGALFVAINTGAVLAAVCPST
jgi:hypothetical protein